jgi:hypothetical protein
MTLHGKEEAARCGKLGSSTPAWSSGVNERELAVHPANWTVMNEDFGC